MGQAAARLGVHEIILAADVVLLDQDHLKLLHEVGLVEREARGTSAFYRLIPAAFERIAALLALPPALAGREPAGAGGRQRG